MIVVTGATGFIGSNLIAELENRGYNDIVAIDSFGTDAKWKNVAKRSLIQYVFPEQTRAFLLKNREEISSVIHLGAISSTTEANVDLIVKNNIQLSVNLYNFCKKNQIPFIYASSAATYGHGLSEQDFLDDDSITYLNKLMPLNPYGWSKLYVDKLIASDRKRNEKRTQVVGLRFFNVYGPNEYHKGAQMSVIARFFNQYKEEGAAKLFKTNGARRDFVYVDDCVDVIIWMVEHSQFSGLFNVGTGVATSYEQLAQCISEVMGVENTIEYVDMPESLSHQYQFFTQAKMTKLYSVGYNKQMMSVSEGVQRYIENYLKNENQKYK